MTNTAGWSPGEHLARVLREERVAGDMARSMQAVVDADDPERLACELERFRAFVGRELEIHFAKEEADLFPALARRGLTAEVAEAKRQHAEIRRLRARLAAGDEGNLVALRAVLGKLATELKRHTSYEADFLYVDLRRAEADEYRADIEAALADGAGG